MTEAMPFLQKYDITFLRPPTIWRGVFLLYARQGRRLRTYVQLRFPFLSQLSVTVAGMSLEPNSPEYRIVT